MESGVKIVTDLHPFHPIKRERNLSKRDWSYSTRFMHGTLHLHITFWLLEIYSTHPMELCTELPKRELEETKIPWLDLSRTTETRYKTSPVSKFCTHPYYLWRLAKSLRSVLILVFTLFPPWLGTLERKQPLAEAWVGCSEGKIDWLGIAQGL